MTLYGSGLRNRGPLLLGPRCGHCERAEGLSTHMLHYQEIESCEPEETVCMEARSPASGLT